MTQSRRRHLKTLLVMLGLGMAPGVRAEEAQSLELQRFNGLWSGRLNIGSTSLTLQLIIEGTTVTAISVDQGGARIPATKVTIEGPNIQLEFGSVNATYEATLTDSDHMSGTFAQGGVTAVVRFNRGETIEEADPASVRMTRERLNGLRLEALTPAMGVGWAPEGRNPGPVVLAVGARSSEDEIAAQPEDQWHWGSITKSMTATLCARLVEAGIIEWDTTVGHILDERNKPVAKPYRNATLKHLLSHRAGLQANLDLMNMVFYSRDPLPDPRAERRKYAYAALKQKPVGALGAQNLYSNNGYIIAGAMLEQLTGKSWESLIETHVFAPLGLTSAGFGAPGRPGHIDQPLGHAVNGDERKPLPVADNTPNDNPVALGPAGRVHMSMSDMLTYLKAHSEKPESFLSAKSWATLHTPHFGDNYALGWVVRPDGALWHNGSNTLWYAEVLIDAKAGIVCCAAGNDTAPQTQKAVGEALMSARASAVA